LAKKFTNSNIYHNDGRHPAAASRRPGPRFACERAGLRWVQGIADRRQGGHSSTAAKAWPRGVKPYPGHSVPPYRSAGALSAHISQPTWLAGLG